MSDDDERLKELKNKLQTIEKAEQSQEKQDQELLAEKNDMRLGLKAGAELITAIAGGAIIGYYLDQWLETKPFFLITMLLLGVITGFVNVWRTMQGFGHSVGFKKDED